MRLVPLTPVFTPRGCCATPHTAADYGILHELVVAAWQEGYAAASHTEHSKP